FSRDSRSSTTSRCAPILSAGMPGHPIHNDSRSPLARSRPVARPPVLRTKRGAPSSPMRTVIGSRTEMLSKRPGFVMYTPCLRDSHPTAGSAVSLVEQAADSHRGMNKANVCVCLRKVSKQVARCRIDVFGHESQRVGELADALEHLHGFLEPTRLGQRDGPP